MTERTVAEKQKQLEGKHINNNCQPVAASGKRRRQKSQPVSFSEKALQEEILQNALALKIPSGVAEVITAQVAQQVSTWVEKRSVVTMDDVWRRVALEARKYNTDLAYVYQNRGKII